MSTAATQFGWTVEVDAGENDVARVLLFDNGLLLEEATSPPCREFTVRFTDEYFQSKPYMARQRVPNGVVDGPRSIRGQHVLVAMVEDRDGLVGSSAPVHVAVSQRQVRDRRLTARDGSCPGGPAIVADPPVKDGMVLWLRSDKGVELDDQGRVCQWSDLSGRAKHANRTDTAQGRPILDRSVGFRGLPAVLFDGEDDALRCTTPLELSAQREFTLAIICRAEFTAEREWPQRVFSVEPAAGADYDRPEAFAVTLTDQADPAKGSGLTLVQAYGAKDRLGLDSKTDGINPVVQGALVWVKTEHAPGCGTARLLVDGRQDGTDTFAFDSADAAPNKGYLLGTRADDTARCAPVEVFEVILYDRALTDAEIAALTHYLQRKNPEPGDTSGRSTPP